MKPRKMTCSFNANLLSTRPLGTQVWCWCAVGRNTQKVLPFVEVLIQCREDTSKWVNTSVKCCEVHEHCPVEREGGAGVGWWSVQASERWHGSHGLIVSQVWAMPPLGAVPTLSPLSSVVTPLPAYFLSSAHQSLVCSPLHCYSLCIILSFPLILIFLNQLVLSLWISA